MTTRPIFVVAHVPPDLQLAFLEYVRKFDKAFPDCHFDIAFEEPDGKFQAVMERMHEAAKRLGLPVVGYVRDR